MARQRSFRSLWRTHCALSLVVVTSAGCGLFGFYYEADTAAQYLAPEPLHRMMEDRDAAALDEARRAHHVAHSDAWPAHLARANADADLDALGDALLRLAPAGPAGAPDVDVALERAGLTATDEVHAWLRWAGEAPCDDEAARRVLSRCPLGVADAVARRAQDRELYAGLPERWLPVLVGDTDVFYVVTGEAGRASPVLYASLLRPDHVVAFQSLRALAETALAWRDGALWPPLDDTGALCEVHRARNPACACPF